MAKGCTKKKIRLLVEDTEIIITTSIARVQALTDLIFDVGGSAICAGNFNLTLQQYAEFASKSISILYN